MAVAIPPEVKKSVTIKPPNMQTAVFKIIGNAPLVVHRFSQKSQLAMLQKMEAGSTATKGKKREAANTDDIYNEAKYVAKAGWEGFNASGIRCAMIEVCRLVGFKMVLAKLCISVIPDGWDKIETHIPLVRIYGKPRKLETWARVETGQAYMAIRPCYDEWYAMPRIRWDADQFTLTDVTNLLARVGLQNGLCEGRPFSTKSAGVGWGTFDIESTGKA